MGRSIFPYCSELLEEGENIMDTSKLDKELKTRKEFIDQLRIELDAQRNEFESNAAIKSLLGGDIKVPTEIHLLAHAFFHIDKEASENLAEKLVGKNGIKLKKPVVKNRSMKIRG